MKKAIIAVSVLAVLGIASVAIAQTIINGIVVNANNCVETDGGLNYFQRGSVSGSFWLGNWSMNGTFWDSCLDNFTLIEGVCGGSVHPNLTNLAGAFFVNCNGTNSTFCNFGRCI